MNFSLYASCEGEAKKQFGTFEHAHLGIRVNALAPGWVHTPMTKGWDDDKGLNAQ
jgi:NAD(P)-dependent dehydrogenase (short-subunit alcohol dehydrogenase family)